MPRWGIGDPQPEPQPIGLERDLQAALRSHIDQLERGLVVIDGGAEQKVASGFIDILARDSSGAAVVIELKAGMAGASAVSQIAAYMGDISENETVGVRSIIVASDFDHRAKAAAKMVPTLRLFQYGVMFSFAEVAR